MHSLPTGVSSTRQALSAAVARLSSLESKLSQLESLGDDDDRLALQRRIDIIERAALEPGVWGAQRLLHTPRGLGNSSNVGLTLTMITMMARTQNTVKG